jgi:hypothetical protein
MTPQEISEQYGLTLDEAHRTIRAYEVVTSDGTMPGLTLDQAARVMVSANKLGYGFREQVKTCEGGC